MTKQSDQMGERISNLQRMISVRRGISGKDDTLPVRFLKTIRGAGPAGENLPKLDVMLREYYDVRGWGKDGIPTDEKLKSLSLDECLKCGVSEILYKIFVNSDV